MSGRTQMEREVLEIPAVVARQLRKAMGQYREVGRQLRRRAPRFMVVCARGSSLNAALFLKHLVETRIGIPVATLPPSVASVHAAPLFLEDAVGVTLSQSGQGPDLASFQRRARVAGAWTLAVLNTPNSRLGVEADLVVPVLAGRELAVPATKSVVATQVAIAGIVAGWTQDRGLEKGLQALPTDLADALTCDWISAFPPMRRPTSLFVISRGPGYPAALEAALKLKEACRLHAEAFSAAEVLHGPIAVAGRQPRDRFLAIVFQLRNEYRPSIREAAAAIRDAGSPVIQADFEPSGDTQLLAVKSSDPVLDPICHIASFYTFVVKLAEREGTDPDHPPGLRKVTNTM